MELEAGRGGDTADLSRELHQLRLKADKLEADGKRKDEENRKLAAGQADAAAAKAQEENMKVRHWEPAQRTNHRWCHRDTRIHAPATLYSAATEAVLCRLLTRASLCAIQS